jgi:hypothetical protein
MNLFLCAESQSEALDTHGESHYQSNSVYSIDLKNRDLQAYFEALAKAIPRIEKEMGRELHPDNFPKIGLNLDSSRAPGLAVRPELIIATLKFLELSGFTTKEIFLVTYYLESFQEIEWKERFKGYELITSQSSSYFHEDWFQDSPMPPAMGDRARFFLQYPRDSEIRKLNERKSLLPACLFLDTCYWINLSTAKDDPYLGIDGAVSNLTLGASGNTERFRKDSTLGPATAAEILAIPEIWEKKLFSVIDLTSVQIAGGPEFDAEFLESDNSIIVGRNPLYLDYHALKFIEQKRNQRGLMNRFGGKYPLFRFAKELNLGDAYSSNLIEIKKY